MIEVKNLYKSFGDKEILNDISVVFERGKSNLIIGASGSGKSVLTKCIVGLHEPTKGDVFFDGRNYTEMNFKERKEIRKEINSFLYHLYAPPKWLYKEHKAILSKVLKDKKNEGESIKMVLLKRVGIAVVDISIKEDQIIKALRSGLEEYSQL